MDDPLSKALRLGDERGDSVGNWTKPKRRRPNGYTGKRSKNRVADAVVEISNEIELDIDHMHSNRLLVNDELDDAITADRYRLLHTRVRQCMKPRKWSHLGITSPSAKEGKSLTAINLAITASRESSSPVFLIDADTRRPSLAHYLGINPAAGLTDYLNDEASLEDIIYSSPQLPGLYLIPNRAATTRSTLSKEPLDELFAELPSENALVIVDLPPALVADDVLLVAPRVDSLLIVLRDGHSNENELRSTTTLLSDFNLMGTVLNCSKEVEQALHGYYYHPSRA